jgi:hypothetical protein
VILIASFFFQKMAILEAKAHARDPAFSHRLPSPEASPIGSYRSLQTTPLMTGKSFNLSAVSESVSRLSVPRGLREGSDDRSYVKGDTAPHSLAHGRAGVQRCFSSRHVPKQAERLATNPKLEPQMLTRFNGLMSYLKRNTESANQVKDIMATRVDELIDGLKVEILRAEFERRCNLGERHNHELMKSSKFAGWLRDAELVTRFNEKRQPRKITVAKADEIFAKVLHDCDYGGKYLSFDLFCKALYLVGLEIASPELEAIDVLHDIVCRVTDVAAPAEHSSYKTEEIGFDPMLDAQVMLLMEQYKPVLDHIFSAYCGRHLGNPSDPAPGLGRVRQLERSEWLLTQQTALQSSAILNSTRSRRSLSGGFDNAFPCGSQSKRRGLEEDEAFALQEGYVENALANIQQNGQVKWQDPKVQSRLSSRSTCSSPHDDDDDEQFQRLHEACGVDADAGAVFQVPQAATHTYARQASQINEAALRRQRMTLGVGHGKETWNISEFTSWNGDRDPAWSDPYEYANGVPQLRNRLAYMSLKQFQMFCKETRIVSQYLTSVEVTNLFKKTTAYYNQTGSSAHGYLTAEMFRDVVGQMSLKAFSKPPLCREYPEHSDKVKAFFCVILPRSWQQVRDLKYGRENWEHFPQVKEATLVPI